MSKRDPAAEAAFYAGRVGQSFEHALRRIAAMDHRRSCPGAAPRDPLYKPGQCTCHVAVAKDALGE